MSYADSLGVLKTISHDKYIDAIRDGIDDLGAKMEAAGYDPTDIRRYFRMVLAKLAGRAFRRLLLGFLRLEPGQHAVPLCRGELRPEVS